MDTERYEAVAREYYALLGTWYKSEDEAEKARLDEQIERKLEELYAAAGERRDSGAAGLKAKLKGFEATG